jgi:hypothetical protein
MRCKARERLRLLGLSHRRVPYGCASHGCVPHGCAHLTGRVRVSHGVHLIYESSLRAEDGWRESLYRHQGCLKASGCGRLSRQAAGHPWSALRMVKSCRKDCPTAKVLLEAKAAALYPERYQSLLSKLSTKREGDLALCESARKTLAVS